MKVFGRFIKRLDKKEEAVVEDVERFIERLEDVLPIEDNDALVETVRWLTLVEKTIEVAEKKMSLDEKLDAMAILQFLAAREVELLYRSSVREIAEIIRESGEDVYSVVDRRIGKRLRALAFLTGRRLDEVLDDVDAEVSKGRRGKR